MKIWKYKLETTDTQYIEMPVNAKILSVQVQDGEPCLWCLVDDDNYLVPREIEIIGTGYSIANNFKGIYIGTYQLFEGRGDFHVFDLG